MRKVARLIFYVISLLVISCEEDINFNGTHKPVLSVVFNKNSSCPEKFYLNVNEDFVTCGLRQTLNIGDTVTSHAQTENSRIEVYSDNELILTLDPENENLEFVSFDPNEGETYQVYGYADGYPVLSGECTIPYTIPINYITSKLDTISDKLECVLNFTDPENYINYYYLETYFKTENYFQVGYIKSSDPVIEDRFIFSDKFINGRNYNLRFDIYNINNDINNIIVELWSLSESQYYSWKSSNLYHEANEDFYAEPVQIYSNVSNGLGVIGAACIARDTIFLK